jgi:hypothetical protein
MAAENHIWGQKRIQAELARLGFQISARTVGPTTEFGLAPNLAELDVAKRS